MAISGFLCAQTQKPPLNPRNLSKKPGPLIWAGVPAHLHPVCLHLLCLYQACVHLVCLHPIYTQPTYTCPAFCSQAAVCLGFLTLTAGRLRCFYGVKILLAQSWCPGGREGRKRGSTSLGLHSTPLEEHSD